MQAAVNAASDGDTVIVPAGTASWTNSSIDQSVIVVSKWITLRGAGAGNTVITDATLDNINDGQEALIQVSAAEGKPFRITGFSFLKVNDTGFQVYGACKNWRVDNCYIEGIQGTMTYGVYVVGYTFGVVDHCTFKHNMEVIVQDTNDPAWDRPLTLGTTNAVYIEDCTFIGTGSLDDMCDGDDGARLVVRYNTITNQYPHVHGNLDGGKSAFSYEIYGNTIIDDGSTNCYCAMQLRGGTGVVFNNTYQGDWGGMNVRDQGCDQQGTCSYPQPDQIGRTTGQKLEPLYEWNNTRNGEDIDLSPHCSLCADLIKEGRDYYNDTQKPGYAPYTYPHPLTTGDTTPPGAPANVRDGTSDTLDANWTYSQITLYANWDASTDAESGISGYKYAIGATQGATNITNGWLTNGTALAVTKTGLTLTAGTTYYFSVKAVNGMGLESSPANSNGQYVNRYQTDTTGPVMGSVRDGAGASADIATTTLHVQLQANWDVATDPETGVNMYSYAIGTVSGGSNLRGWTDVGANLNITATGLGLTYGATYYFSVKAQNTDGYWGQAANSNGQRLVDTSPPTLPSEVRDGALAGADIDVTFSTTALTANWDSAYDAESGIGGYDYAIGTTPGGTNITNGWITNYTNMVVTKTGLNLSLGSTYYFRVRAVNGEGLPGNPSSSDGQYVSKIDMSDTTPPANIPQVRDGTAEGVDIPYTASATVLSANWDASVDNESEVARYWYAIGTSPGATNVVGWTDNGAPVSVTRTGLVLTVGATYYFSVKAENGVGLQSGVKNSNGQCVVASGTQIPPVISNVKAVNITANSVTITWDTDKAVTSQVEYGLTVVYGKMTIENSYFVTAHNVVIMGLAAGTTYHYRAISRDGEDNQAVSPDYTFSTLPTLNKVTDVNAYPNPVDFSGGQQVKFVVKGDEGAEVSIYTIRARLVRKITGTGEVEWDGTNDAGERVERGVYIYIIKEGNGDKITGKIFVIK